MVWKVRDEDGSGLAYGRPCPDYGPGNEKFTIRMHHSGEFIKFRVYSLLRLVDSEFELSDDDIMFDSNIDPDLEWRGFHFNNSINVEQETSELGSQFSDGTQSTHHGHPIFNKRMDVEDPKFELDKQKGLIDAVDQLLPGCEHRNTTAYEWLMQRPATHWSKSHFSTHYKSDILLNNMSESFNHMVLRARSKHIVDMLETIRLILMKRVHMRRDQMMKHTGRPKKHARKKDPDEVKDKEKHVKKSGKLGKKGVTMKCSLCHQPNHNARGCQLNKKSTEKSMDVPAADPDRRSNGRKRKTPTPEKEPDVISPTRVTRSTSRSNIVTSPTRVTRSSTMTSLT
ncbi:UNVERIFIED_CONTAM: hypothetical protein Scaly_2610800 [Sesamum calycinum]|uniref:Uncharacterized protein n=1 Tax=Sesamum calycinum TaxID=2727403 RepID=A0AAW2JCR9_9LAMI